MTRIVGGVAFFVGLCLLATALAVGIGVLYAHFHRGSEATTIAYACWILGGLIVLLVGASGSPGRMATEARIVWVGRFAPGAETPLPQSPLLAIPVGLFVIGVGILFDVYS